MEKDYIDERRLKEDSLHQQVANGFYIRRKPLEKQSLKRNKVKFSKAEYTFLQFSKIIWDWAIKNNGLKRVEIEVLLYMYPLVAFSYREFTQALKEMSSNNASIFGNLKRGGWINIWNKSGKSSTYVLSNKANTLVSRMHRMFMFEEEIPTSSRRNVMLKGIKKKDNELLNIFKKFNQIVKDKNEKNRDTSNS